ncbi:hypothetical protein [Alicyclobacillus mengziensis]|uniref:Uncharacterized protein n=1 Tax=Alicyclobacillus mengziensis TaxID=2931921 RepID=A0A9X7Z7D3_9BACL|nr:hypothetical protein [Alicyclobacillus mengziensis]QSO48287.1 hypothetical protein JZ786_04650 [Alicyclobacillus mengziensis]
MQFDFTSLLAQDARQPVTNHHLLVLTSYVDAEMADVLFRLQQYGNTIAVVNPTELVDGFTGDAFTADFIEQKERTVWQS